MKFLFTCMLVCCGILQAQACDVCGGAGSQLPGMLPMYANHFIGLQAQYRSFSSTHPGLTESSPATKSEDYYRTLQVWGRYNIGSRLQVYGFVPYQNNTQQTRGTATTTSGIGDVSLLVNAALVRTSDTADAEVKHLLLAGGGVKMPTGRHNGATALDRSGLPNMQPGTGTWDFTLNVNYTLRYGNNGLYADAMYMLTTADAQSYKYGNRMAAGVIAFRSLMQGNLSLLPQAGIRYEYTLHDYDNYERKWLNEQTGGNMLLGTAGIQASWKRMGMQLTGYLPLQQHYADGYVQARFRLDAGLFILL